MKVTINTKGINIVKSKLQDSLVETADAIKSNLINSRTMPFAEGTLQNTSTFVDDKKKKQGKVSIVSDTPYARRLYYHPEYNFRKDKNPSAGGMWFEPYINGGKKDFARKAFVKIVRSKLK